MRVYLCVCVYFSHCVLSSRCAQPHGEAFEYEYEIIIIIVDF